MAWRRFHSRSVLLGVGATLLGAAVLGVLILASGVYNVAASSDHFAITRWILEIGMRRSVTTYSLFTPPRPEGLDDVDRARLGAGHYARGCAFCHGAPGEPTNPIVEGMLPKPPALPESVPEWSDAQLFRIVRHGLKYTGMPAWPALERGDEVWSVIAFLRRLPGMTPDEYRSLVGPRQNRGRTATEAGGHPALVAECATCHGDEHSPPRSRLAPVLAGQTFEYLVHALANYASGSRPSGMMQPVARELDPAARVDLARFYAELSRPVQGKVDGAASSELVQSGRRIATAGIPDAGIPPCLACHSGNAAASFPLLSGQHAPYIVQQLTLWQQGLRDRTAQGAIMASIARRLSEAQIRSVAAYFEARDPSQDVRRAGATSSKAP